MRPKADLCFVYLIGLHMLTAAPVLNKVNINSARAVYNSQYFANFTLYALNGTLSADIDMLQELGAGFKMHLDLQYRLPNSPRYQSLFGYDVDVCGTRVAMRDNLMRKVLKSLLRYGNFMENCPVPSGHYYLQRWRLVPALVPKYLHPGDYRIKGRGYFGAKKPVNEEVWAECEFDATLT